MAPFVLDEEASMPKKGWDEVAQELTKQDPYQIKDIKVILLFLLVPTFWDYEILRTKCL